MKDGPQETKKPRHMGGAVTVPLGRDLILRLRLQILQLSLIHI